MNLLFFLVNSKLLHFNFKYFNCDKLQFLKIILSQRFNIKCSKLFNLSSNFDEKSQLFNIKYFKDFKLFIISYFSGSLRPIGINYIQNKLNFQEYYKNLSLQ